MVDARTGIKYTTGFAWAYEYDMNLIENPKGWESISAFHTDDITEEEFQERLLKSFERKI